MIVAIFNRLDTDASGGVSIAELVKAMRRDNTLAFTLGLADRHLSQTDGTMDKIAALFYKFDDDQGRQLSVNGFAKLIKSAEVGRAALHAGRRRAPRASRVKSRTCSTSGRSRRES